MALVAERGHERLRTLLWLALAGLIGLSGLGWACTVQQRIYVIGFQASPGGQVDIRGDWVSSPDPIYIRWNDQTGPVLAEVPVAANGTFSASVTVPEVPPGVYYLLATSGQYGIARAPVHVIGTVAKSSSEAVAADRVSSDLWGGFDAATTPDSQVAQAGGSVSDGRPEAAGGYALTALGVVTLLAAGSVWVVRKGRASAG